jgi:xanthine dehydrogenase molybdopterin-binding subunit B
VDCTTQWTYLTHRIVSQVLGLKNSSCVDVQVKQLGGAFGGKQTRANFAAAASALAAYHLNAPVKVYLSLEDCMVGNLFFL